jgi:hypothetical protein
MILIVLGSICPFSYVIVQQAPKNTYSGSSLIAGIKRILIAMYNKQG